MAQRLEIELFAIIVLPSLGVSILVTQHWDSPKEYYNSGLITRSILSQHKSNQPHRETILPLTEGLNPITSSDQWPRLERVSSLPVVPPLPLISSKMVVCNFSSRSLALMAVYLASPGIVSFIHLGLASGSFHVSTSTNHVKPMVHQISPGIDFGTILSKKSKSFLDL
jgi:hypothetical protein